MTKDFDPQAALNSIRTARVAMGDATLDYPVWWDIQYGLIVALMVGGAALAQPWSSLTLFASLEALFWMMRSWRKRFGWWVNGYSPPRAKWVAMGMAGILIALMGLSLWTRFFGGPIWAPILGGAIAFVVAIVGGRLWMRVFRKDLEEGAI